MCEMTKRQQHLFIVRMWQELGDEIDSEWRGSVEHVPSGQRIHFTSLVDLNDFIGWRLESTPVAPDDGQEQG
jgi:hypothetical protein